MLSVRSFRFTFQKLRDLIQLGLILCISLSPLGCSLSTGSIATSPTSTDSTFKVTTDIGTNSDDWATAMAVQSDGKILLAGESNTGNPRDFAVVRYNTDGSLDSSFGTGGKVTTDIGTLSSDSVNAIAVQSDGKILLGGRFNPSGSNDFAVVRYNTDGSLDSSFGTGGKVTTDIGTVSDETANAIAVQSDGKILLAGKTDTSGTNDFAVVRYNSNGTLDATFGTAGKAITDIGTASDDTATAMTLQSDGKILLAGFSNAGAANDFTVIRYNSNGALDATFGTGGKVTTDIGTVSDDIANAMAVQSDGKILLAGYTNTSGTNDFTVIRYSTVGTLDASFGTGGKVTTDIGTTSVERAYAMTVQSDGKIALAGSFFGSSSWDFAVVRYNSNGTLDSSFGTGGTLTTDIDSNSDDQISAILIESDGKILLGGASDADDPGNTYDFALKRILATGQ